MPHKEAAAKPVVKVEECNPEVEGIWFDRRRGKVLFCFKQDDDDDDDDDGGASDCNEIEDDAIKACERENTKIRAALKAKRAARARRPKRVCFGLDPVSGDTKKIASRQPPRTKPRVRITGKRIMACPVAGHRCEVIGVRSKPLHADLSVSGRLLAVIFSRANKRTKIQEEKDYQASNTWWIEIYEVKSRRRLSRFVVEKDEDPATEFRLQWLGEVLSASWMMGPGSGTQILDWKRGKKVCGLGHDAKRDHFSTRLMRAHHVSGNRWASLNGSCNPLVIQDVVTGALMRVKLDALYANESKKAEYPIDAATMVVIGPKRLVLVVTSPQVAVGIVDTDNGKVLKHRRLGCPPFGGP